MARWWQGVMIGVLAPVLVVQALRTRARALRLPEAAGPRAGEAGPGGVATGDTPPGGAGRCEAGSGAVSPGDTLPGDGGMGEARARLSVPTAGVPHDPVPATPLRLLIAGDSAAAGVGVADQGSALSGQMVAALAPRVRLRWRLVARTGWRSADLYAALSALPPEPFDVALLSLGVNDVTAGMGSRRFTAAQVEIARLLADRFGVRLVLLTAVPPMQHMTALPRPLRDVLGLRAARFNAELRAAVAGMPGVQVLTPDMPFTPDMLAEDGFHPAAPAYRLWAKAAVGAMDQSLPTITSLALMTA